MPAVVTGVILGVTALGGVAWWALVARHGDAWLRVRMAKRFGVEIGTGLRGHWEIKNGGVRGCLIEMLQLAVYVVAFAVWSIWTLLGLWLAFLGKR